MLMHGCPAGLDFSL